MNELRGDSVVCRVFVMRLDQSRSDCWLLSPMKLISSRCRATNFDDSVVDSVNRD